MNIPHKLEQRSDLDPNAKRVNLYSTSNINKETPNARTDIQLSRQLPQCYICKNIINKAHQLQCCQEAFCLICIEKYMKENNKCPKCGKTYLQIQSNLKSENESLSNNQNTNIFNEINNSKSLLVPQAKKNVLESEEDDDAFLNDLVNDDEVAQEIEEHESQKKVKKEETAFHEFIGNQETKLKGAELIQLQDKQQEKQQQDDNYENENNKNLKTEQGQSQLDYQLTDQEQLDKIDDGYKIQKKKHDDQLLLNFKNDADQLNLNLPIEDQIKEDDKKGLPQFPPQMKAEIQNPTAESLQQSQLLAFAIPPLPPVLTQTQPLQGQQTFPPLPQGAGAIPPLPNFSATQHPLPVAVQSIISPPFPSFNQPMPQQNMQQQPNLLAQQLGIPSLLQQPQIQPMLQNSQMNYYPNMNLNQQTQFQLLNQQMGIGMGLDNTMNPMIMDPFYMQMLQHQYLNMMPQNYVKGDASKSISNASQNDNEEQNVLSNGVQKKSSVKKHIKKHDKNGKHQKQSRSSSRNKNKINKHHNSHKNKHHKKKEKGKK